MIIPYGSVDRIDACINFAIFSLDPVAYIRTEIILENDVELQSLIVGIKRAAQIPAPQLDELLTDLSDRYACLMIGDIQDSVIQKSCKSIIEIPEKYHKFILHDGDIILSKAPIPIFKSAVYEAKKKSKRGSKRKYVYHFCK